MHGPSRVEVGFSQWSGFGKIPKKLGIGSADDGYFIISETVTESTSIPSRLILHRLRAYYQLTAVSRKNACFHREHETLCLEKYVTDYSFKRLVRFLAKDGRTYYGDAILPAGETDIGKTKQARIIDGDIFGKHDVTDKVADVRLLLAPLAPEDVRTVRCLGMNYEKHAIETNLPIPKFPVLFVSFTSKYSVSTS